MISRIFISIPSVNTLENKASRHKQRSEQPSLMPNLVSVKVHPLGRVQRRCLSSNSSVYSHHEPL